MSAVKGGRTAGGRRGRTCAACPTSTASRAPARRRSTSSRRRLQRARHRPVGGRVRVHHLLRQLRRAPPARVLPRSEGPQRLRVFRVGEHLPAGPQGRDRPHPCTAAPARCCSSCSTRRPRSWRASSACEIALPPRELREHVDSKIVTTQLGNEAGRRQRPERAGPRRPATSRAAHESRARPSSATTWSCRRRTATPAARPSSSPARRTGTSCAEKLVDEELKVMRRINHLPGTVEAVRDPARHAGRARSRPTSPGSRS